MTLLLASTAAFGLALLSAVAGFGGGVLLLPVFTALFGLRFAVPMLTLTQLSSNGSWLWLTRHHIRWPLVGWFAVGAVPLPVVGALLHPRPAEPAQTGPRRVPDRGGRMAPTQPAPRQTLRPGVCRGRRRVRARFGAAGFGRPADRHRSSSPTG